MKRNKGCAVIGILLIIALVGICGIRSCYVADRKVVSSHEIDHVTYDPGGALTMAKSKVVSTEKDTYHVYGYVDHKIGDKFEVTRRWLIIRDVKYQRVK